MGERLYYFWLRFRWAIVAVVVLAAVGAGAFAGSLPADRPTAPADSDPSTALEDTLVVAGGEDALETCAAAGDPEELFECRNRLNAKNPVVVRADGSAFLIAGRWRGLDGDGEPIVVDGVGEDLVDVASGFVADLDNDGSDEYVLSVGKSGERRLVILSAGPDGRLRDTTRLRGFGGTCSPVRGCIRDVDLVLPIDADADGWLDLVVSSAIAGDTDWAADTGRDLSIVSNRGWASPGTFVESSLTRVGRNAAGTDASTRVWRAVDGEVVDLDRDGQPDLLLVDRNGNGAVHWGRGSLAAWADSEPTHVAIPIGATGLDVGDIDGDADDDILVSYDVPLAGRRGSLCTPRADGRPCTPYPGMGAIGGVAVLLGDGRRAFSPAEKLAVTDIPGASDVVLADLDADGGSEILVARENIDDTLGGVVVHRAVDGAGGDLDGYASERIIGRGPVGRIRAADVDGDGLVDVAMTGRGAEAAQIWRNNGEPVRHIRIDLVGSARLDAAGTTPSALGAVVTISDLDGDDRVLTVTANTPPDGLLVSLPLTSGGWTGDEDVPRIEVLFPATGRKVALTGVKTGATLRVDEPAQ